MRGQSILGAAVLAVQGRRGGRGLYEGGEEGRPGRSQMTYMQHKYTALDTRIIIITAAILLLLLSILFLNFFIRWALRRFFLFRSQKPPNPNKGLSKRQVQALPSFIYSSSKPPIFCSTPPTISCPRDNFAHDLNPISSHSCHDLHPTSTKVDEFYHSPPTTSKLDEADHNPPSPLASTKRDYDPPTKFVSLKLDEVIEGNNPPTIGDGVANDANSKVDEVIEGNNPPTTGDGVANDANSIIDSTKANVLPIDTIDSELKASSPTSKSGNSIIGCTKAHEMSNHGDDNATSPSACSICLVDYADGDRIRVLPTCRHYFHSECIDMWLAKSSSCPTCRANILEATRTPIKQPTLQVQVIITTSH